ncbi:GH32 C-terminal domain-containing protein [Paenibacillus sp. Soil522]
MEGDEGVSKLGIRLRILVDNCSVEVFANDGEAVIAEIFF